MINTTQIEGSWGPQAIPGTLLVCGAVEITTYQLIRQVILPPLSTCPSPKVR